MTPSTTYRPLHPGDSIALCARADATGLALFEEAELRQGAAQQLVHTLGVLDGIGAATETELQGCFLALRLLLADATALYSAARVAQQGGGARRSGPGTGSGQPGKLLATDFPTLAGP